MPYLILTLLLLSFPALAQRKDGNPLDQLPANIEVLTHFGERADFSPDNRRVAFMDKSFGDAFVIDLKTRVIRCLTCRIPGAAFLRVMHLVSGDYLLIGPERFTDVHRSRSNDNELWFLSQRPGSSPQRLDQKMSEGAAISKTSQKIAFSVTHSQDSALAAGQSQLFTADLEVASGTPRLTNKHLAYESRSKDCTIEAQDFFDHDRKMTFTCYEPHGLASVMVVDLDEAALFSEPKTQSRGGSVTNMSKAPGTYNECEGIYPDGLYTNVEADRQVASLGGEHGSGNIDIWKLRLDGSGKDFKRLTNFNDYQGFKASNPVVSTDGRLMAFQVAHPADEAGVGYGILLYHFQP
jgi:Tol biopolymer transport system component